MREERIKETNKHTEEKKDKKCEIKQRKPDKRKKKIKKNK